MFQPLTRLLCDLFAYSTQEKQSAMFEKGKKKKKTKKKIMIKFICCKIVVVHKHKDSYVNEETGEAAYKVISYYDFTVNCACSLQGNEK